MVLLNCFRPINNGRAGLRRTQKQATGASRLKASKELAGMGIGKGGEKGVLMHVCGKEKASFKETLWNAQLLLGAPSTATGRIAFSLSGNRPTFLATCQGVHRHWRAAIG